MEQIIKIGTCLPGWMAEKALDAAIDAGYETCLLYTSDAADE